jgi:phosphate uptake regulator
MSPSPETRWPRTRQPTARADIELARCLERIGDNTVDIAEQTVFVVTGLYRQFAQAPEDPF